MTDYKKLYEDAILRMNKWVEGSEIIDPKEVAEFVFPELKESEDEKIRKAIHIYLDWLDGRNKDYKPKGKYTIRDMIAWLEKQGEQIPANSAKTCKDEQKHADNVEPKFHEGDWVIVRNKDAYQVIEVNAHDYRLKHVLGSEMPFPFTQESSLKSWTIEDAKDGNVLATNYFIFIFKNIDSNNGVHYYCQYEISKHEDDNQFDTALPQSLMGKVGSSHYSPATKEQREQLEKAMTDAGYTFDSDKKELKKIEQGNSPLLSNYSNNGKNAWSEEDEKIMQTMIKEGDLKLSEMDWLKSLKDRVQPKQEWSEEDENLYTLCESAITTRYNDGLFTMNEYKQTSLWLKSLKDRI